MRINVLALDDVFDLGLSAILDAFQTANELIGMSKLDVPRFELRIVGVRKTIRTAQGLGVPLDFVGWMKPDCVVVPAIGFKMPDALEAALARQDIQDSIMSLHKWSRGGAMMTAACIGTFVMARIRFARSSTRNHHLVAGTAVSEAISQCPARRRKHGGKIGSLRDCGCSP